VTVHLVLVGMMATGKTTAGHGVAERLGRAFFDSDELVEAATGRTVREIFATDGEAGYRPLETAALIDALNAPEPAVIAAAGGVVLAEANRRALCRPGVTVVWLRAPVSELLRRIEAAGGPGHRPLLDEDPEAALTRLSTQREPLYREVADAVVDVDGLTPEQVVDRVAAAATAGGPHDDGR
jgi:shikimate kinase